jgi:protein-disulfide isomerase
LTDPKSLKKQVNLLWVAVAALLLLNVGSIAYFLNSGMQSGDPHGHDEPMAEVAMAELLKPGPLEEMSIGDPNAPNVIVEYASMTCPHCAEFHKELFPEIKSRLVDTGKVRFIFREFPLDKLAAFAFMVARCSGKDGYFPMIDSLFKTQETWAFAEGDPMPKLFEVAKQAGFTQEKFDKCVEDQDLFDKIVQVRKRANEEFKVNSTPSFFVNGKPLDHPEGIEAFEALLQ